MAAHRFSYQLHYGAIPDGLFVCHKCDNRGCVRPEHLFVGTAKDNTADMLKKGRARGGTPKLTTNEIKNIKEMLIHGVLQKNIANKFGVSISCISAISVGIRHKHVK